MSEMRVHRWRATRFLRGDRWCVGGVVIVLNAEQDDGGQTQWCAYIDATACGGIRRRQREGGATDARGMPGRP